MSLGEHRIHSASLHCFLFVLAGDVRTALLDDVNPAGVAGTFTSYLRELPDPVVPEQYYEQFITAASKYPASILGQYSKQEYGGWGAVQYEVWRITLEQYYEQVITAASKYPASILGQYSK